MRPRKLPGATPISPDEPDEGDERERSAGAKNPDPDPDPSGMFEAEACPSSAAGAGPIGDLGDKGFFRRCHELMRSMDVSRSTSRA